MLCECDEDDRACWRGFNVNDAHSVYVTVETQYRGPARLGSKKVCIVLLVFAELLEVGITNGAGCVHVLIFLLPRKITAN